MRLITLCVYVTLFALSGCECSSSVPSNPTIQIMTTKGYVTFKLELATTEKEKEKGLMERTYLAADSGMLFIFNKDDNYSFWMKNTLLPLDLVFFNKDWVVVGIIENMTPHSLESRSIEKPSRFVLELNAGTVKRNGIETGNAAVFTGKELKENASDF